MQHSELDYKKGSKLSLFAFSSQLCDKFPHEMRNEFKTVKQKKKDRRFLPFAPFSEKDDKNANPDTFAYFFFALLALPQRAHLKNYLKKERIYDNNERR